MKTNTPKVVEHKIKQMIRDECLKLHSRTDNVQSEQIHQMKK